MCNNFGCGNSCTWVILLIIILVCCCGNGCGGCGCGDCDHCNNNCGC